MPYGELGSVEKVEACGCCYSFSSNLTPGTAEGGGGLSPGCGCSGPLVEDIVSEMKQRMKARGDTGNIQRAEQTLTQVNATRMELAQVNQKLDQIMQHLNIVQMGAQMYVQGVPGQQMQQGMVVGSAPQQVMMEKR